MFNHTDGDFDVEGCSYTLYQNRATVINSYGVREVEVTIWQDETVTLTGDDARRFILMVQGCNEVPRLATTHLAGIPLPD